MSDTYSARLERRLRQLREQVERGEPLPVGELQEIELELRTFTPVVKQVDDRHAQIGSLRRVSPAQEEFERTTVERRWNQFCAARQGERILQSDASAWIRRVESSIPKTRIEKYLRSIVSKSAHG